MSFVELYIYRGVRTLGSSSGCCLEMRCDRLVDAFEGLLDVAKEQGDHRLRIGLLHVGEQEQDLAEFELRSARHRIVILSSDRHLMKSQNVLHRLVLVRGDFKSAKSECIS